METGGVHTQHPFGAASLPRVAAPVHKSITRACRTSKYSASCWSATRCCCRSCAANPPTPPPDKSSRIAAALPCTSSKRCRSYARSRTLAVSLLTTSLLSSSSSSLRPACCNHAKGTEIGTHDNDKTAGAAPRAHVGGGGGIRHTTSIGTFVLPKTFVWSEDRISIFDGDTRAFGGAQRRVMSQRHFYYLIFLFLKSHSGIIEFVREGERQR